MEKRTARSVWRAEKKNNKLTSPHSSRKRRKISSGNQCIRTCHRRSFITRTRWQIETYHILIKDNATGRTKLWNLWQRISHNNRSHYKMEIILAGCHREIWSLDGSRKSQILQRATQTQWITSSIVFEITRLWFHTMTYSRKNKYEGRCSIKKGSYQHYRQ